MCNVLNLKDSYYIQPAAQVDEPRNELAYGRIIVASAALCIRKSGFTPQSSRGLS